MAGRRDSGTPKSSGAVYRFGSPPSTESAVRIASTWLAGRGPLVHVGGLDAIDRDRAPAVGVEQRADHELESGRGQHIHVTDPSRSSALYEQLPMSARSDVTMTGDSGTHKLSLPGAPPNGKEERWPGTDDTIRSSSRATGFRFA